MLWPEQKIAQWQASIERDKGDSPADLICIAPHDGIEGSLVVTNIFVAAHAYEPSANLLRLTG